MSRRYAICLAVILSLAVFFRIALALTNQKENDNHLEVITLIQEERSLPDASRCWECFHPKMFYLTGALLLETLGVAAEGAGRVPIQLMNAYFGLFLLLPCYLLLSEIVRDRWFRLLLFALVALNPPLTIASAQASNDILSIMLTTFCFFAIYRAWKFSWSLKQVIPMVVFCLLANITKPSSIPCFAAMLALLAISALGERRVRGVLLASVAFIVVFSGSVFLGEYYRNTQRFGTPFVDSLGNKIVSNHPVLQRRGLHDWITTEHSTVSVRDSLLTFRLASLIRDPVNPYPGRKNLPVHMTSLWTQLYARLQSVRFHFWPTGAYQSKSFAAKWLYRGLFIVALFPLYLFFKGLWGSLRLGFAHARISLVSALTHSRETVFLVFFAVSFGFYFSFNILKVDQSAMKAVYFFPGGVITLLYFLGLGADRMQSYASVVRIGLLLLSILYVLENGALLLRVMG